MGLSDGYQQGIEWSRLTSGTEYSITKPTLTTNVPSAVTPYVIKYRDLNPVSLLSTVELLRAFGTVKVLSSPKLAVLNNQTATLKVSEDFVYFNVKQDTVPGGPNTNATVTTTTTPQSVSIGFFMSLTAVSYTHLDVYKRQPPRRLHTGYAHRRAGCGTSAGRQRASRAGINSAARSPECIAAPPQSDG